LKIVSVSKFAFAGKTTTSHWLLKFGLFGYLDTKNDSVKLSEVAK